MRGGVARNEGEKGAKNEGGGVLDQITKTILVIKLLNCLFQNDQIRLAEK